VGDSGTDKFFLRREELSKLSLRLGKTLCMEVIPKRLLLEEGRFRRGEVWFPVIPSWFPPLLQSLAQGRNSKLSNESMYGTVLSPSYLLRPGEWGEAVGELEEWLKQ
jgi:hypothetical protein